MAEFNQRQYVQMKANLTRATNAGEPGKIIDHCLEALAIFEASGYPDDWQRWVRAYDQAVLDAQHRIRQYL